MLVKTCGHAAASRSTPPRRIARVGAGVLWEDVVDAAAPHGLIALHGSSPERRRRRLLARRRHGLARPQPRPADQQPDRDRARHRRRRARPHRRATTTPSCSGRCAAAAATSASSPRSSSASTRSREVYAGFMIWDWTRGRARAHGLRRVGRRRARPRHHVLPDHAAPAAAGDPGADPRPLDRDHRRRRPGRPGRDRAAARARARRSTRSRRSPRPRSCACTRTRRSRCRYVGDTALIDELPGGGDRGAARRSPARARARRWRSSSCASSAARWRRRDAGPRRRRRHRRRSSCCSLCGMALDADMAAFMQATRTRIKAALEPWQRRRPLPQLRRGRRSTRR